MPSPGRGDQRGLGEAMPILYVNPHRKGRRKSRFVKGRASVHLARARKAVATLNPKRKRKSGKRRRKGKQPAALAAYWAGKKRGRKRKASAPKKRRRRSRRAAA